MQEKVQENPVFPLLDDSIKFPKVWCQKRFGNQIELQSDRDSKVNQSDQINNSHTSSLFKTVVAESDYSE